MTLQSELTPTVPQRPLVQHNYRDHSNEIPQYVIMYDNIGYPNWTLSNGSYEPQAAAGGRATFPMKLHELLDKTEEDGLADIVSWKPHGRAFVINNAKKFADIVLPQYFDQIKLKSFKRQLNLYDFTKISGGPDMGAYYHEMFLRGKILLVDSMTYSKVKGTRIKASANPKKDPNFYSMSFVGTTNAGMNAPVVTLQSEMIPQVNQRLLVQHNYHDHSNDKPLVNPSDDSIGNPKEVSSNNCLGRTFPMKLHELLDKTEEDGLADIVSWKPHGRAFIIHNAKKFSEIVLPQYFGQTKFLSFQRQLSLYDFTRISTGPDMGAYYHEMFLRGKIFLTECIKCRRVKGTRIKASTNPEKEPNFYAMSYVGTASAGNLIPVKKEIDYFLQMPQQTH